MIGLRFIPREEWEGELKRLGCYRQEGVGRTATGAEWWRFPWPQYPFPIPADADGRLAQRDWDRILVTIGEEAPDGWTFPDE